jgi:peroxisomal enoyl-CoA hydratase 2
VSPLVAVPGTLRTRWKQPLRGGGAMTSFVTAPAFEDLSVGDEAPPLVVENISRTHFVRYAGASGDFNPMHHDDTVATSIGNPSVFGHGMLTAGLMARVLKDWFGPAALRRYQVRFSKQVWPGETLTCTAIVTGLRDADESDVGLVDVECQVVNQDGEAKLTGSATAAVPRRG